MSMIVGVLIVLSHLFCGIFRFLGWRAKTVRVDQSVPVSTISTQTEGDRATSSIRTLSEPSGTRAEVSRTSTNPQTLGPVTPFTATASVWLKRDSLQMSRQPENQTDNIYEEVIYGII